jgi:hypothetical protein
MVKPLNYICTLKLLKPCGSISREFDLIKILFKSGCSTTTHDHTQVRITGRNHKTRIDCSSPLILGSGLASSDFQHFVALKDVIRGKSFGNDDKVLEEVKKWLRVKYSDWYMAIEVDGDHVEK